MKNHFLRQKSHIWIASWKHWQSWLSKIKSRQKSLEFVVFYLIELAVLHSLLEAPPEICSVSDFQILALAEFRVAFKWAHFLDKWIDPNLNWHFFASNRFAIMGLIGTNGNPFQTFLMLFSKGCQSQIGAVFGEKV